MDINTVALIGAGAIGSYFIAGLSEKLGDNLWVIAEGDRKERLEKNGIQINHKQYKLNVKIPEEAAGADFLIVAVKYGALQESVEMVKKIVDEHTIVISPLNGVDSENIISEQIGESHMIYSLMKIAAQRVDNSIVYDPDVTQGIFFGEKNRDNENSEKIKAMVKLFSDTPVHFHLCENILQDIWFKYALNISKNLPQAIINCEFGAYDDSEHLAYISNRMRDEVVQVAAAKGIDIKDTGSAAGSNKGANPKSRFSTLQDLDAKRTTEIEMFSGTLIRMGKELGIKTPFNEFAYHAIKCLEEKNAGKIQ